MKLGYIWPIQEGPPNWVQAWLMKLPKQMQLKQHMQGNTYHTITMPIMTKWRKWSDRVWGERALRFTSFITSLYLSPHCSVSFLSESPYGAVPHLTLPPGGTQRRSEGWTTSVESERREGRERHGNAKSSPHRLRPSHSTRKDETVQRTRSVVQWVYTIKVVTDTCQVLKNNIYIQ